MRQDDLKLVIDYCRLLKIGHKINVTDQEIQDAVKEAMQIFSNIVDIDEETLITRLHSFYNVVIDEPQILEGNESRRPWLNEFRANQNSEWLFWKRYKKYLQEQKGYSPQVIMKLDNLTDTILDKLFNPSITDSIRKAGLVVGQVQSGKTSNYTGLICKAADAGFNMIIVLAGIHNNLRSQTQNRLDEDFLGFDTRIGQGNRIGVGLYREFAAAIANNGTTSLDNGDSKRQIWSNNFNLPQPTLFVIKKNSGIMRELYNWLKNNAVNGVISDKSLLLIDDEADNATVNVGRDERTAINRHLHNIIGLFSKSAYVGYTATPFANIFVSQEDLNFPKDFIINLPSPSNYIGPDKVFGITNNNSEDDDNLLPIVTLINDFQTFVPSGRQQNNDLPEELPDSLKLAIKCFIITCAIRILRGHVNKHNSMLIHASRLIQWQRRIKELVEEEFYYYKTEIENGDETVIEAFRQAYMEDTPDYTSYVTTTQNIINSSLNEIDPEIRTHSWEDVKPLLYKAVQKIEVREINARSNDALTYYEHKDTGISVIAVGGDRLSRGLTLEGLSISYFLRASRMYDTLMQMGRWFGYRQGYMDLCRLFTSPQLNEWYRHITLASEELREEFTYLYESGGTPDTYSLKVRNHPGILQITSLGKMRHVNRLEVSWAGRLVETYQLEKDLRIKKNNITAVENLIDQMEGAYERPFDNYLWRGVPAETILNFLDQFKLPRNLAKVNLEFIGNYIRTVNNAGELTDWNVAVMSRNDGAEGTYLFENGFQVNCFKRNHSPETTATTYYLRKNRILSPKDELIDIDQDTLNQALERTRQYAENKGRVWGKDYPNPAIVRQEFRDVSTPLLIIYPLNPKHAGILYEETDKTPFMGFAISFPHSNTNTAISYTVNQVAINDIAESEEQDNENNDE